MHIAKARRYTKFFKNLLKKKKKGKIHPAIGSVQQVTKSGLDKGLGEQVSHSGLMEEGPL